MCNCEYLKQFQRKLNIEYTVTTHCLKDEKFVQMFISITPSCIVTCRQNKEMLHF